jgi:hypothetical protein
LTCGLSQGARLSKVSPMIYRFSFASRCRTLLLEVCPDGLFDGNPKQWVKLKIRASFKLTDCDG